MSPNNGENRLFTHNYHLLPSIVTSFTHGRCSPSMGKPRVSNVYRTSTFGWFQKMNHTSFIQANDITRSRQLCVNLSIQN